MTRYLLRKSDKRNYMLWKEFWNGNIPFINSKFQPDPTAHITLNDAGDMNTEIYYIRTKSIDPNGRF